MNTVVLRGLCRRRCRRLVRLDQGQAEHGLLVRPGTAPGHVRTGRLRHPGVEHHAERSRDVRRCRRDGRQRRSQGLDDDEWTDIGRCVGIILCDTRTDKPLNKTCPACMSSYGNDTKQALPEQLTVNVQTPAC